jgi:hypothetical protein
VLVGLGYLAWTSAENLIKGAPSFFPGGKASAIELEAGAAWAIWGTVSARALLEYHRTHYALDADPTGTYTASGATDASLGLRLLLRAEY